MSENITRRLAASGLNMEKISIQWLFKIVETISERKLTKVSIHFTKTHRQYCVLEFESSADAQKIYDFCDGLLIEDTNEIFDLAYIPDAMDIGEPAEECTSIRGFQFKKPSSASNEAAALELSDEEERIVSGDANEDIEPAVEEPVVNIKETAKKEEKEKLEKKAAETQQILEDEKDTNNFEEFKFDLTDERFKKVFDDQDFALDASNKKYKKQAETDQILSEVRKRYE